MRIVYFKLRGIEIGEKVWILVDLARQAGIKSGKLKIGNRCILCANTLFMCGDGYNLLLKRNKDGPRKNDEIIIKDNSFIGIGAIIMNGVTIGPNAIVGAGAVVVDDVKPNTCVAGNPSRYICNLDTYAKVSEGMLIDGYGELRQRAVNKGDFLSKYFWK